MGKGFYLFDGNWWAFWWRYRRGRTPWDTGITPPEVMAFLTEAPPGRALDLGCGTGTNAITLFKRGWQVTGIDFSIKAIRAGRRKAIRENLAIDLRVGDVTRLEALSGPFDYALDIGCLHAISDHRRPDYARGLQRLVRPGGTYMLYAWLPRDWRGKQRGMTTEAVYRLFGDQFHIDRTVIGEEGGAPTAWYWFTRI